jgi:hypothetical protein
METSGAVQVCNGIVLPLYIFNYHLTTYPYVAVSNNRHIILSSMNHKATQII